MSSKPRIFYVPHKDARFSDRASAEQSGGIVKKILFATDLSMASEIALRYAGTVAQKLGAGLLGIYAFDVPRFLLSGDSSGAASEEFEKLRKEYDQKVADFFTHPALVDVDTEVRLTKGYPDETLGSLILESQSDLSMVARHRRATIESFFLGADSEKILRLATRPIWVVPEEGIMTTNWKPVIVAVDFSVPSKEALAFAIRMSAAYGVRLTVVHVMDIGASLGNHVDRFEHQLGPHLGERRNRLRRLVERYGAPKETETLVVAGTPAQRILEIAEKRKTDLLVMGIHGDRMQGTVGLGFTASALLRLARMPIILCPAGRAS